jgi:hypothetical protein
MWDFGRIPNTLNASSSIEKQTREGGQQQDEDMVMADMDREDTLWRFMELYKEGQSGS